MRNWLVLFFLLVGGFAGCTSSQRARGFGGTTTIELPAGKKLVVATWKEGNDLWFLLRDAKKGESAETLEFVESNSIGVFNGKVIFHEHIEGH